VRIMISGSGISPSLQKDFSAADGTGTIDGVPAGTGRTVTAQGLVGGTVIYQGASAPITVLAGQTADAGTITMNIIPTASFDGTIVLGAPTASSIKANVFSSDQSGTVFLKYGTSPGVYDKQTASTALVVVRPSVLAMDGLTAGTRHYYRLFFQAAAGNDSSQSAEYTFHTARPAGSTFTFTIQADSHLDDNSDPEVYRRTLANVLADAPDFHIDLGDTFMCEKHSAPLIATVKAAPDQATVDSRYVYERAYFGLVSHSAPLFLVNGNHEGELGWLYNETALNIAIWTTLARQQYYMNPVPDSFYSGDAMLEPFVGKRASWYAWQWGDALFVVLDPYWYSKTSSSKDAWAMTLGETQYKWLQQTLSTTPAKFKFVFVHNLVGGLDGQMRGGIEAAPFFEWGGKNLDGTDGFSLKRSGWSMPIHQLLVKHGVTAVFHGHDHIYAKQLLDGVVYQEVPQPSSKDFQNGSSLATEYHYATGTILSSSGHIRVTVGPDLATVEYVRAWLPKNETSKQKNGQVDDTWSIVAP
ncbi:MAG: metallophosphoesterase, partial [Deltaproteobacteria bacterium]